MNKPKSGTKLMAHLEQLISQGDSAMFFQIEKTLSPSLAIWDAVKVRSIELLIEQGLTIRALNKACLLKSSLCSPMQRKHAELLWHYLNFLLNGRQKEDEARLIQLITETSDTPHRSPLQLCAARLKLRLTTDRVLIGSVDAHLKKGLIQDYRDHLKTCLTSKLHHDAFTVVKEISDILLSKPLPMADECLIFLKQCIRKEFIGKSGYRKATLYLIMAEISFEKCLRGAKESTHLHYYKLANEVFTKIGYKYGSALINESYGALMLKYGKSRGKHFLDKAIRCYEQKEAFEQSLKAHTIIIHWLEKQGHLATVTGYQIKANEIREATDAHIIPERITSFEREDLPTLATRLISLDQVGHTTQQMLPKFEQHGETLHLARVLEHLSRLDEQQSPLSKTPNSKAINLYMKLGYKLKAATLIKDWLVRCAKKDSSIALSIQESTYIYTALAQVEQILEEEPSLEPQEVLAASYQAIACILIVSDEKESVKYLKKADSILSNFGLMPQKALNTFYQGCLLLESGSQGVDKNTYQKAADCFETAFMLFKVSHYQEGMWRSLFGKAICLCKQLEVKTNTSILIARNCVESFRRALQIVYRLSEYQVKTYPSFGEPLHINPILQANASQLFQTAIHFFSDTMQSSTEASRIITKLNIWVLLNHNQSEKQPN